jgi:hypothetical protein
MVAKFVFRARAQRSFYRTPALAECPFNMPPRGMKDHAEIARASACTVMDRQDGNYANHRLRRDLLSVHVKFWNGKACRFPFF